jgi:hypothetical protein
MVPWKVTDCPWIGDVGVNEVEIVGVGAGLTVTTTVADPVVPAESVTASETW